jgi:hypothetical protein
MKFAFQTSEGLAEENPTNPPQAFFGLSPFFIHTGRAPLLP